MQAQSDSDRLRAALRNALIQARSLEDQIAVLQAKQAESNQMIDGLKHDLEDSKAKITAAEQAKDEAVDEFNKRLDERNEALEKWKTAYSEAADVARAKDAERAKFESESKTFKASAKACSERNIKLVAIGNDLLQHLDSLLLGDWLAAHEPLIGFKRVEVQNELQDYKDKILEQKASQ
ncbi:MAG TPA: hypothetical protein VME69_03165 [Methylocella sp.]|nr:hypothetical protein [Methylocella sp.]